MLKILIIIIVIIILIVLDFVLAPFRPGLLGIPYSIALLMLISSYIDFFKSLVKVRHSMTAEELLKLTKKEKPIYKRKPGRELKIYNNSYDNFYVYKAMRVDGANVEVIKRKIILPYPKYYYTDEESRSNYVSTTIFFELEEIDARRAVRDIENKVYISKLAINEEISCESIIYNDLGKEVTIKYLGNKDNPTKEQLFTMKNKEFVVVENNSLISLVSIENTEERDKAEKAMLERLQAYAGNTIEKIKGASIGDESLEKLFFMLCASGLAGMACHEAVKALGKPQEIIKTKSGKKFYKGDATEKYIFGNKYSVSELIQEILYLSDDVAMSTFLEQSSLIGGESFVIKNLISPEKLYKKVKDVWDGLFNDMSTIYCKTPDEWPIFYSIVLKDAVKEMLAYDSIFSIYKIVIGIVCTLAQMDEDSI